MVSVSEMRGHKHCSLKELEKLDLEKFKKLVPVIVKKFELSLKRGWVIAGNRSGSEEARLFKIENENTTVFNLINGRNTIEKVVEDFSVRMSWDNDQSFSFVKKMVIDLVRLQVCTFTNPVDD